MGSSHPWHSTLGPVRIPPPPFLAVPPRREVRDDRGMSNGSPPTSGTPSGREEADIAGIVLAGGASRRMGRDKATLRMPTGGRPGSETLLEAAARHLTEAGATRVVIATGTPGRLGPLPWPEVGDGPHAGQGPLAGLAAALQALADDRSTEVALVLAVDLPFAEPRLLRWLAHELVVTGVPGLIPLDAVDGRPQPLHAAYRPGQVGPALRATLADSDDRRLLRALAAAGAVHVETPDFGRTWQRNVNTPVDLGLAVRRPPSRE